MKLVGLMGGIGAGKSSVSTRLEKRGAVIIDADIIARRVVQTDGPAYDPLIARFGQSVLQGDGTLNRGALASIVFNDAAALADLNAITHPAIRAEIGVEIEALRTSDVIVILDAALLFETPRAEMVAKMVVDVDPETAVTRLVAHRGFTEADAWARIRSQQTRSERLADTDYVLDNSGSPEQLDDEVEKAWLWILSLPNSP